MTPIDPLEYGGLAVVIARDFVGRGLDLDDLIQEGMIAILRAIRRWTAERPGEAMPPRYAAAWIRTALRNPTRPRSRTVAFAPDLDANPDDRSAAAAATVDAADAFEGMAGRLAGREREVVELTYRDGMADADIARRFGRTPRMVRMIRRAALAKLREALA